MKNVVRFLVVLVAVVVAVACDMKGPASIADVRETVESDQPVLGHHYMSRYSMQCDYQLELEKAGTIIEWTPMPGEVDAEHAWRPWEVEAEVDEDVLIARYSAGGGFERPESLVVIGYGTTMRGRDRIVIDHGIPEIEPLKISVYPPQYSEYVYPKKRIDCKSAMGLVEYGHLFRR